MNRHLNSLASPQDLKKLSIEELSALATEIRSRIIDTLSITGGHLSSNLGIVELTIALHYVFHSPKDKLLFDVGHQSYVHKILTGRNNRFPTIRQSQGLSGFTNPNESIHDHFHSGHAGNTLSLALGMAKDRDLLGNQEHILPILGDAALTCGLTLEAMNNIPKQLKNFTIVLNDNAMSISKNVGAVTAILSRFFHSPTANNIYREITQLLAKTPIHDSLPATQKKKIKESLKNLISTAPFFEQFGLNYVGPIDGHNIEELIKTFDAVKKSSQPKLIHILTVKGQGMKNALNNPVPYHGAKPFDRITGEFHIRKNAPPTFPKIFGKQLLSLAAKDSRIVAITPAMPVGSCLDAFMQRFPKRCIDVGIAEGHSITYAAGIAAAKKQKVIACVYSTFLQRAFDNIYHDVCIQNIPVIFAIDRSGIAAGDGVTAQGIYDIAFLNAMPNMVITQPRNAQLLKELLQSALDWNLPTAIRYPNLPTREIEKTIAFRKLGKGEVLSEGSDLCIIALGHMEKTAFAVKEELKKAGISTKIIDPIFLKPLDKDLLLQTAKEVKMIVTLEEHSLQGGLGSIINTFFTQTKPIPLLNFGLPDQLIPHGGYQDLLEKFGLSPTAIANRILNHTLFTANKSHDYCSFP